MKKLSFQAYMIISSSISLLLTAAALGVVFWNVKSIIDNQASVSRSQELVARINKLSGYVTDMETGIRGFLISGDQVYLDPYNTAEAEFEKFLNETLPLATGDKDQLKRLESILDLKNQWIEGPAIDEMMIRRKRSAGKVSEVEFIKSFKESHGKILTDAVRATVNEILSSENKKLESLRSENIHLAKNIHSSALVVIFTMIFGFGLTLWTTNVISKVEKSIRAANRTIEAMLHSMKLSVFAVDKEGQVLEPVSRYSNNIFQENIIGKKVFDCVYKDLNKKSEQYSYAQTAMCVIFGESEVQWSLQEDNLPKELIFKPTDNKSRARALSVSYSPIWDDQENLDKLLFVVDDVTDVLRLKKEAEEAKSEVAENNQILQELSDLEHKVIEDFFSKIRTVLRKWEMVAHAPIVRSETLMEIFREMHTLKGNSRIYRMSLIASRIHEVELSLSKLRSEVGSSSDTNSGRTVFSAEEISVLSEGVSSIRHQVSKYSRVAQKIYKIVDEIQSDMTADLHRAAWEEQAALAKLRSVIQLGMDFPDFTRNVNEAIKISWRSLVKLRLMVNGLPDKSLIESVGNMERGLTALAEEKFPTVELFESHLLKAQESLFYETSKYLLNGQFTRPMNMETEAWVPVFDWALQLSPSLPDNFQEILLKAKTYCAAQGFDYLDGLFANLLERTSVLDLSAVTLGIKHIWTYLSFISILDITHDSTKEQKVEFKKILSDYLIDKKKASLFSDEKLPMQSILAASIRKLSKRGMGPKEFFKVCAEVQGESQLEAIVHLFIGDPEVSYSLTDIKECFTKVYNLKDIQTRLQQLQSIVPSFKVVVDEALSRDESMMPPYLLIYDIVRILRALKIQASDFEPLSLPRLIQISEMSLDKLRKTVKDLHPTDHSGIKNISSQMDKILELPVSTIAVRFVPMIQELSAHFKKEVQFQTKGLEITANRQLLYSLQDILLHLFRNSLDHGIEASEERLQVGKSIPATLKLEVFRNEPEKLTIVINDDGRGIDPHKVSKKALEKAIVTEAQLKTMSEEEIIQLIFLAGFSTADEVTQVSGIGIGMEVVKKTIEDNQGVMKLKNQVGKGLEISIEFPA